MELSRKQIAAIKGFQAAVVANRSATDLVVAFPDSAIAADVKAKQEDVLESTKRILHAAFLPE